MSTFQNDMILVRSGIISLLILNVLFILPLFSLKYRFYGLYNCLSYFIVCVAFLFWYAVPAALFLFKRSPNYVHNINIQTSSVVMASLSVIFVMGGFSFIYWILKNSFPENLINIKRQRMYVCQEFHLLRIILFSTVIGILPYIISNSFLDFNAIFAGRRAADATWLPTSRLGGKQSLSFFLFHFQTLAMMLAAFLLIYGKRKALSFFLFSFNAMFRAFTMGTRSPFLMMLIGLISLVIVFPPASTMLNKKRIVVLCISIIVVFSGISNVMLVTRSQGIPFYKLRIDQFLQTWQNELDTGIANDMFSETVICSEYLRTEKPLGESQLLLFIINPIPRLLWPEKPASQVGDYYNHIRMEVEGDDYLGNVLPGIIGQFGLAGGIWGFVSLSFTISLICYFLDILRKKINRMYIVYIVNLSAGFMFISFRNFATQYAYPIIIFIVLTNCIKFMRPKKK